MYSTYDQVTEFSARKASCAHLGFRAEPYWPRARGLTIPALTTFALEEFETIIVNCNPERSLPTTTSPDRLYFEPLTLEDVLEVYRAELLAGPIAGVIVQLGGQTPLALAKELQAAGCRSSARRRELSTWPKTTDCLAPCLRRLVCKRRSTGRYLTSSDRGCGINRLPGARASVVRLGRARYADRVLTSGARKVFGSPRVGKDGRVSRHSAPLLIDRFLDDATEIDVDAIFRWPRALHSAASSPPEAGIHSGDSACVPTIAFSQEMIDQIFAATEAIARGVGVMGLVNIQFAIQSVHFT